MTGVQTCALPIWMVRRCSSDLVDGDGDAVAHAPADLRDGGAQEADALKTFTFDKEKLHEAVEKIDSYGVTDIGAAVEKGIEQFEFLDHKRKSLPKFIVLLTDGEGDCKDEHIALAKQNNIKIYRGAYLSWIYH